MKRAVSILGWLLVAITSSGLAPSVAAAGNGWNMDLHRAAFTRRVTNLEYTAEPMEAEVPYPLAKAAPLAGEVQYGAIRRRIPGVPASDPKNRVVFAAAYRAGIATQAVYDANMNGDLADDSLVALYSYPEIPGARAFLANLRWTTGSGEADWVLRVVLEPQESPLAEHRFRLQAVYAMSGEVVLGGRAHRAVLLDGNRDGEYTKSQGDGILIDYDDDKYLSTETMSPEYGPFRVPFQIGDRRCEVALVDPRGESVLYRDLGPAPPRPQAEVGKPAPDFRFEDPAGRAISLSSLRGKVVLLDFWVSWCGRCELQASVLKELYDRYRDRGLAIIGISYDPDASLAADFRAKHGQVWPTDVSGRAFDENDIGRLYKADAAGRIFLIDRDGTLEGSYVETDPLRARLEQLLGGGQPSR